MPLFEPGVPAGGDAGHFLAKKTANSFDMEWIPAPYADYVYFPSGVQAGNVYTSWSDLYAALLEIDGPKTVTFAESCTLPAGAYNMNNVAWFGDFVQGSIVVELPTGFTITDATNMTLGKALFVKSTSNAPIITITGGLVFVVDSAAQIATSTAPIFYADATAGQFVLGLANGGSALNSSSAYGGYEVAEADASFVGFIGCAIGDSSQLDDDTFRSTSSTLVRLIQSVVLPNISGGAIQTNMGGGVFDLYFTKAVALSYDNTVTGLTATNVQDAIDELFGLI